MKRTPTFHPKHSTAVHLFLLLCVSIVIFQGCGSDSGNEPATENEITSFAGKWMVYEAWQGCLNYGEDEIIIQIDQNADAATLNISGQSLTCRIIDAALRCTGDPDHGQDVVHAYGELTLWFDENRNLSGEAGWTDYEENLSPCSGTSTISSSPNTNDLASDEGAIQIENRTENRFELINIVPCDASSAPWGPNQLTDGNILGPNGVYQVNGIPQGCYSVRICRTKEQYDNADCIVYHQNIYVQNDVVYTISLEPD